MAQIYIPGDAAPGDVSNKKKFSAGVNYQAAGTLTDYRAYPMGTAGYVTAVSAKSDSGGNIVLEPPTGIYTSGKNANGYGALIANDPNFVPANWRADKTMFGTPGTIPVITDGADPAQGVGKWGDGALAVYPREGYRKGGAGAGEIKVSVAQLQSVNAFLAPQYILSGAEIFGINGTAIAGRPWASGTSTSSSSQWAAGYPDNSGSYIGYRLQGSSFSFNPSVVVISGDNDFCVFYTGGLKLGVWNSMVVHGYHFGSSWLARVDDVSVAVRPGFFGLPVKYATTSYNWFAVG